MNRIAEIASLRRRIRVATAAHKRKMAGLLMARLQSLMIKQLKAEIKGDKNDRTRNGNGEGMAGLT